MGRRNIYACALCLILTMVSNSFQIPPLPLRFPICHRCCFKVFVLSYHIGTFHSRARANYGIRGLGTNPFLAMNTSLHAICTNILISERESNLRFRGEKPCSNMFGKEIALTKSKFVPACVFRYDKRS